jgi:hypothetical protein
MILVPYRDDDGEEEEDEEEDETPASLITDGHKALNQATRSPHAFQRSLAPRCNTKQQLHNQTRIKSTHERYPPLSDHTVITEQGW